MLLLLLLLLLLPLLLAGILVPRPFLHDIPMEVRLVYVGGLVLILPQVWLARGRYLLGVQRMPIRGGERTIHVGLPSRCTAASALW